MNIVILQGRLVADPETSTTTNGTALTKFKVAVQRSMPNENGEYDADYINCIAWKNTAEFVAKHFVKGKGIGIRGRMQTRSYEKDDGTKAFVTEVVVEQSYFPVGGGTQSTAKEEQKQESTLEPIEDDLPF